jgi:hypothetical protein
MSVVFKTTDRFNQAVGFEGMAVAASPIVPGLKVSFFAQLAGSRMR